MGEKREISMQYPKYSALNEGKHKILLCKCELCTVTSLQRVQYGKGRKKSSFTVEKADKHYFTKVIKININS